MKTFFQKNHRTLFYGCWLLLGLLQAGFTQLQDDEAYYWVYSKFLSWGYFDHPPMIALLIKLGTVFFANELGVRLFPVLLNTLTLWVTEKLIEQKNQYLFYAICLSAAVLQLAGFMAVPDIPLLFFTALFFLCYKRFIEQLTWKNTLFLGIATACLLYSKYHSVLIIFFTLLSNIKILKQPKTYIAGILALALFTPHLWWQYQHDWISFKYHLFESNVNPYKFEYTSDYIIGQILIAGPLTGIILLISTFGYNVKTSFERALKYTAIGFFVFFFISSFRGRVEANWTSPAIIPMLVLTHNYLLQHIKLKQWLYRLLPVTLLIVLFVRIVMVVDILPVGAVVERFHAWKGWPQQLKAKTQNRKIVFNNSYQRASKYWFYTGQMSYSLNSYKERRNNYNFWPVEDSLLGKPVYIMDIYNAGSFNDSIQARLWKVGFTPDSSFNAFARVLIHPAQTSYIARANAPVQIQFTTTFPDYYKQYLQQHPQIDMPVIIGIFQGQDWVKDIPCALTLQQLITHPQQTISIDPKLDKGIYFFRFAMASDAQLYTHNSDKIKLEIQ